MSRYSRPDRYPEAIASIRLQPSKLISQGIATVRFEDGTIHRVELHWYEAHGIGRKKLKIKEYLD